MDATLKLNITQKFAELKNQGFSDDKLDTLIEYAFACTKDEATIVDVEIDGVTQKAQVIDLFFNRKVETFEDELVDGVLLDKLHKESLALLVEGDNVKWVEHKFDALMDPATNEKVAIVGSTVSYKEAVTVNGYSAIC